MQDFLCFSRLGVGLQFRTLRHHRVAGALLAGIQVVVAHDEGAGVGPVQFLQQAAERGALGLGAGVGGTAADVQSALVADAQRVAVVVHAVGADHLLGTTRLYLSAAADNVVVAYHQPPSLPVPVVNLCCRRCLVVPHCRTVNNNQCDISHTLVHDSATLHGQRTGDGGEHGAKELGDLNDFGPVDLHKLRVLLVATLCKSVPYGPSEELKFFATDYRTDTTFCLCSQGVRSQEKSP